MSRTREAITEEGIIKRMPPRWCPVAFIGDRPVAWLNLSTGEIARQKVGPDNALIALLCGAIRLARELEDTASDR